MATLLLTGLGTLVGGPLGGALGALAGQRIDQAVIGTGTRKGPRLKELAVQASSYGVPVPRVYGRMRVAGSVIWATELEERREKHGGGKGKPKTVTYSYSSSFAVALASRPIGRIERIWADGSLLRGRDGTLKVPGEMRLHHGHRDQAADPLIAAAEQQGRCPAFRGLAYVVFEDLELAEFGNRIPSLSFEVVADEEALDFGTILTDLLPDAGVGEVGGELTGFAVDGSVASTLETIDEIVPLSCTVGEGGLQLGPAHPSGAAAALLPPPVAGTDGKAGPGSGVERRREPVARQRLTGLRYYDVARDFQPGVQRGRGRALPGDIAMIDFPAALDAGAARTLADSVALRTSYSADRVTYRVAQLDPAVAPGNLVRIPGAPERWRVEEWEWSDAGVELSLCALPHVPVALARTGSDPGRVSTAPDLALAATRLAVFELPWDGHGSGNSPAVYAAASGTAAGWRGAALYLVQPDAGLLPLGPTGRGRSVMGTAANALGAAPVHLLDRHNTIEIELVAADLTLSDATVSQLAMGANRALLGEEIIQFASAVPLGEGHWRLADLLRGRGGTESAVHHHLPGEAFVLLDEALIPLDPAVVGDTASLRIAAQGLADPTPVISRCLLAGATSRPLSPVHPRIVTFADGGIELCWTRRARGAWTWPDGVDAPLAEPTEGYLVTLGPVAASLARWETGQPRLTLSAAEVSDLRSTAAGESFAVRQIGGRGVSEALILGALT